MIKEQIDGAGIVIPAVVDYEVRRSLILAELWDAVARLDALYDEDHVVYLEINKGAMKKAAELWAMARKEHRPTTGNQSLDGDVILSARAMGYCSDSDDWAIVTENVEHISRYVGDRARSRRSIVDDLLRSPRSLLE